MKEKVLVIIVTFNAMNWIERCLSSIPKFADIYVIDNGSNDGTQRFISKKFPSISFHQSKTNLGFGAANNIGLQYAISNRYEYIYLLNQDAWLTEGSIEHLIQIQKDNPIYGILSPMQCQRDLKNLDKDFSIIFNQFCDKSSSLISVPRVMAAHWLISKDCLLKVGGFSPSFHHYGEDDNYCDRALFHGFKIGIDTEIKVVHDRSDRVISPEKQLFFDYIRTIVFLSDFTHSVTFAFYGFFCDCLKFFFRFRRFTFVSYTFNLLSSFYKIRKNRKISKLDFAFLRK